MKYDAVAFDLDGVLLSTDNFHYLAWKKLADREGIYFDRKINDRLRGVSRMESLEIILERATRAYTPEEKQEMCTYKNTLYRDLLAELTPQDLFPKVLETLDFLEAKGLKIAVASSSKNTRFILEKTGLLPRFEGRIADGTCITKSKPDPEVFLKAAAFAGVDPKRCLGVEDADAGIIAAHDAGMGTLGVGPAALNPLADYKATDIAHADFSTIIDD